jgi:lysophospholipase L1-like esterase
MEVPYDDLATDDPFVIGAYFGIFAYDLLCDKRDSFQYMCYGSTMNDIAAGRLSRRSRPLANTCAGITGALLAVGLFSLCYAAPANVSSTATQWVGTWSTAPQLVEPGNVPPAPGLSNNTLRQVVRVSIGGDTLRMRLSNEFSTGPVTIHAVHIAISEGGSTIDSSTDRTLYFVGRAETTIAPGGAITSDPCRFTLQPRADLAITISYGNTSSDITGHPGSRTTSYLLAGNAVSNVAFAGAVTTDHWYTINAIDVLAPPPAASVAILGNSITDGRGSTTNMQNRWPDVLSESLLRDSSTRHVGVLNLGIGGNCVLAGGLGPTGVSRFDRDILNQQGVRWAIVFEGVNDIGGVRSAASATATADNLIAAYRQMVVKARAKNIRIYGGTILPFNGNSYYNQYSELCRNAVNQWIRTKGNFDGCVDFDKVMRNPLDTTRLVSTYQNDGLHPDAAGYKTMGESIDPHLFMEEPSSGLGQRSEDLPRSAALGQNYPNPFNPSTTISFSVPTRSFVSMKVFDSLGREVGDLVNDTQEQGSHSVNFDASALPSGMYVYKLSSGSFTQAKKMLMVK